MQRATTLVHKGAMEIGVHSIRSFARYFAGTHTLTIHTDKSIDDNDKHLLLKAAEGIQANIVSPGDRAEKLKDELAAFPKTKEFLSQGAIYTKLEIPMYEEVPYFFFDSDIIWLRHVENLVPTVSPNAFSTESWTWYNGVANDRLWIRAKTPRRVNSGFYYISQAFPYQKMEEMLAKGMFDATIPFATDQEIFAYLYNDMEYYHPEDLKRSRVGMIYLLKDETCGALHFPGKMWMHHMDQITKLADLANAGEMKIRYLPAVPLTSAELFRMRAQVKLSGLPILKKPLNLMRKLRKAYR